MSTLDRRQAYLKAHQTQLADLKDMWEDPGVQLYNDPELPADMKEGSVFLAGPTSRHQLLEFQWRARMVALLRHFGFNGWIFCPEPRGLELAKDFTERGYIHKWESDRLLGANHAAFWMPRKADELLGLNSNLELGIFIGLRLAGQADDKRLFVGWPPEAERMGLPNHYKQMADILLYTGVEELCQAIVKAYLET
jgi:hypothetical protein